MGAFGGVHAGIYACAGRAGVTRRMVFDDQIEYVHVNLDNERGALFASTVHRVMYSVVGWIRIAPLTYGDSFRHLRNVINTGFNTLVSPLGNYTRGDWELLRVECHTTGSPPGSFVANLDETNFRTLYDSPVRYVIYAVVDRTAQGNTNNWQYEAATPRFVWDRVGGPVQRDPHGMPAHWSNSVTGMFDVLHRRVARLEGVLYHQAT